MKNTELDTIGNIYAAVGQPEAWVALVGQLCGLFDANIGVFAASGQGQRDHSFYAAHNHSERQARAYSDFWWQHDIWQQAAIKKQMYVTGTVGVGTDLVSAEELRASIFYKEWLLPMQVEHLLATVVADGSEPGPGFERVPPTHISFFRPPGSTPFGASDIELLTRLTPHLRRGFEMDCQWRAMKEQLNVFHTSVDSMDFGVAFIDAAGQLRHANSAAAALAYKLSPANTLGIENLLQLPADAPIKQLINAAAKGQGGAIKLQGIDKRQLSTDFQAMAVALPVANPGAELPSIVLSSVLLLIVDNARRPDAAAEFLSKAFLLTKSESRLLPLLIKGHAPAEIAKALNVKLPTVRSQLSAVFSKTRTARQQDLIALASAIPPVAPSTASPVNEIGFKPNKIRREQLLNK